MTGRMTLGERFGAQGFPVLPEGGGAESQEVPGIDLPYEVQPGGGDAVVGFVDDEEGDAAYAGRELEAGYRVLGEDEGWGIPFPAALPDDSRLLSALAGYLVDGLEHQLLPVDQEGAPVPHTEGAGHDLGDDDRLAGPGGSGGEEGADSPE